ncbi:hypothetical protein TNCV_1444091 [Trichonephila clavipes]|nr:hypothetical protein TNCV_1444091 [Trichonephila clavipes]
MASSPKKNVQDSKCHKEFQTWWTEKYGMINKGDKAVCVLCSGTVAIPITARLGKLTPSFISKWRHLSSADLKFVLRNLILPRASKPNEHSRDLFHAALSYDMAAVDFLHQDNPPNWAGVEPATNQLRHPAG